MISFSIDRGGTFTDIYCEKQDNEGQIKNIVHKLLSQGVNYKEGPVQGIKEVLEMEFGQSQSFDAVSNKIKAKNIKSIRMGTTVATNALLERQGAQTALLVTKGFPDLLQIGNQTRPNIFDLRMKRPDSIYQTVVQIDQRVRLVPKDEVEKSSLIEGKQYIIGETGEYIQILTKLNEEQVTEDLIRLKNQEIEALSIVLLHSPVYPLHECQIAQIAQQIGFKQISVSSQVIPMVQIVPRGFTCTLDAYLNPFIYEYARHFIQSFDDDIQKVSIYFMQSDGGLCRIENFRGGRSILSGPAGGVIGYAKTSQFLLKSGINGFKGIIGFDMGGTSTDVSRYDGSHYDHIYDAMIAGVMVQTPHLDINTVAAGGGSRLFLKNGVFKVGPESSGASPGPVCYGRDGGQLSVTDANLVLGKLLPQHFPSIFGPNRDQPLFKEKSIKSFEILTDEINREMQTKFKLQEVAQGFIKVANQSMCRPIRTLTQGKGIDPRTHILNIFGGAGAQHACSIAQKLGIQKIFIHQYAGILSAYGLSRASVIEDLSEPTSKLYEQPVDEFVKHLDHLQEKTTSRLVAQGFNLKNIQHQRYLGMRYEGSDTSLMIEQTVCGGLDFKFDAQFLEEHRDQFGFLLSNRKIRVDNVRVRSTASTQQNDDADSQPLDTIDGPKPICQQEIIFEDSKDNELKSQKVKVFQYEDLVFQMKLDGPCIILNNTSTIIIDPGWVCFVTQQINLSITKILSLDGMENQKLIKRDIVCNPIELAIFGNRFMSIAEQMGRILQQTAVSTNIKQRLDFSCAIFSPQGDLVANAPHLPVHLGSMSEAVKHQIRLYGDNGWLENQVILTNHPCAGGSHLPDITVITPVFGKLSSNENTVQKPLFYVASRGHHADVGGLTPGSMPPFSRTIYDEGVAISSLKIVNQQGQFEEEMIKEVLSNPQQFFGKEQDIIGTRALNDNLSDLKAQVAANNRGARLILDLIHEYNLDYVHSYMRFIQENAQESVRRMLQEISIKNNFDEVQSVTDEDFMDDGTQIQLTLTIDRQNRTADFDFSGTGLQVLGNTNTPLSVTYSAIIYCLRAMVDSDIPLNQGCLKPITVKIPKNSILNPHDTAAIVGGNVLTSQRITDVILRAFRACANSQGCMNNFTFGNDQITYYETIGGGGGAGPSWNGQSGIQCHMTNTRITDPEVFERRYPVLLRIFKIRENSGGDGKYKGGNGIIREFEFLQNLKVSILSQRRVFQPRGLLGGEDGQKGLNLYISKDRSTSINLGTKNLVDIKQGQIIRIETPGGGGYGQQSEQLVPEEGDKSDSNKTFIQRGSQFNFARQQESV